MSYERKKTPSKGYKGTVHLTKDGKLQCNQKSFYPLKTSEHKEDVNCQYCLRGPNLQKVK